MNLKKKSLQGYFFSSPPFFYIKCNAVLTLQMLKTGPDSPKAEISLTYTTFSLHPHSLLIYNNMYAREGMWIRTYLFIQIP